MPASGRIALVFDCDGTIAEDTTTRLLIHLGVVPHSFWSDCRKKEAQGWEPTLAFMKQLIDLAHHPNSKKRKSITEAVFAQVGPQLRVSKGIPQFFREVKAYAKRKYEQHNISLHIYIVSGGIEAIIRASKLNRGATPPVDDIFGCRFAYDKNGLISFPTSVVTFTEKTKYLFAINKGGSSDALASNPWLVNDHVPEGERSVPLSNMIYIGDGPTDVPCMSLLKRMNCSIIAVYTEPRQGIPKNTYELARQARFTRGPFRRDYRPGSDLRRVLESELDGYAERILSEIQATRHRAVRHAS